VRKNGREGKNGRNGIAMSKIAIRTDFVDSSLGFPVVLDHVHVLVKPRGDIPLIDSAAYQRAAALALAANLPA
jgi:hypothetical protein